MASVSLINIEKRYGAQVVIPKLNVEIADGSFVVLVGPSGCGKTTTLNMIAGLEPITAGQLLIGARDVTDLPPKNRDIAMVFQSYALFPHMNVFDNIAFGMKIRRLSRSEIDTRVRNVASRLRIDAFLDRRPKALSGGQRQRVALARAMVRRPGVFLMDEPLSNLDAKLRIEARSFLTKMHHEVRTTTVYVTHDQSEAMTMGDTIVVMKDGLIQQAAAPLEVYNEPANMFVAGFIGSPAMNFLELSKADTKLVDREYELEFPVSDRLRASRRAAPSAAQRRTGGSAAFLCRRRSASWARNIARRLAWTSSAGREGVRNR
jgi:multiple sugar transport system ATP-binding protein